MPKVQTQASGLLLNSTAADCSPFAVNVTSLSWFRTPVVFRIPFGFLVTVLAILTSHPATWAHGHETTATITATGASLLLEAQLQSVDAGTQTPYLFADEVAWAQVAPSDPKDIRRFIERFPQSSLKYKAQQRLDELDDNLWYRISGYDVGQQLIYLNEFPDGLHAEQARSFLSKSLLPDIKIYRSYLVGIIFFSLALLFIFALIKGYHKRTKQFREHKKILIVSTFCFLIVAIWSPIYTYQSNQRGPAAIISAKGFEDDSIAPNVIAWTDIEEFRMVQSGKTKEVGMFVRSGSNINFEHYLTKCGTGCYIIYSTLNLDMTGATLLYNLNRYLETYKYRR